jgi:hypothetical protein
MQSTTTQLQENQVSGVITTKEKLAPHHVKVRLSRDVSTILKTCLHQFEDEEREIQEKSFNVDAVISGRSVQTKMIHERRTEVAKVRPLVMRQPEYVQPLTRPSRGNFIPSSHFSQLFAI